MDNDKLNSQLVNCQLNYIFFNDRLNLLLKCFALHQVNWQNLNNNLLIDDLIETTKNNISWLVKLQLPVYLFTFIISNDVYTKFGTG